MSKYRKATVGPCLMARGASSLRSYCAGLALAIMSVSVVTGPVFASQSDLVTVYVPWNPVQPPDGPPELAVDCLNNNMCIGAAEAVAVYFGLKPGALTASLRAFAQLGGGFEGRREGEEFRTYVKAPRGYRVCDVKTAGISAAPMGKRRSPTFAATVQNDQLFELYSFVHKPGIGGGRSWVDTLAEVKFARIGSVDERSCYVRSGIQYQYRCNQQQYQGMPLCTQVKYGKIPRQR